MPELMWRNHIGVFFMHEMRGQFFEGRLDQLSGENSFRYPKQIMGIKVVWKFLGSLLLTTNGIDHPIDLPGGNAMLTSHFRVGMINTNPPIPLRILLKASIPTVFIGCVQMSQILKTHPCIA